MAENLLTLTGGSLLVGSHVLFYDVSLSIHENERIAILGANGAGKTSVLRALHGLTPLTQGQLSELPAAHQAMVFQRPTPLRTSVLGNVRFVLRAHGVDDSAALAMRALDACGLSSQSAQQARTLSGGEQQRLALACAWALKPKVLFADEPTANLDRNAVKDVEQILLQLHAQGTALVVITHSLGQAKRISDRIIFFDEGRLVEDSPTTTFFTHPRTARAAQFLDTETTR